MSSIERIKARIEQIERLLFEIMEELEKIGRGSQSKTVKKDVRANVPNEEELRSEYEKLYEKFIENGMSEEVIEEFVKGKNKDYLKVFCKVNKLPIDTSKVSKKRVTDEIIKWMKQRVLITKPAESIRR
jgi:hypothetical protein